VIGRNTQGVRLIDLEEGERLAAVARVAEREDEGDAAASESPVDAEEAPPETDEPPAEPEPEG
jgi:DNA gyrase subunit A